jgi:hypothetical protein
MDSTDEPPDEQTPDNRFAMVPLATVPKLAELSKAAVLVYLTLRSHANRKTGLCCPSKETIRNYTKLDERSVRRGCSELESVGIVRRNERPGTSNQYELIDEIPSGIPQGRGGQICPDPKKKGGQIWPMGGQICPGGRSDLAPITESLTEVGTEGRERAASAAAAPAPSDTSTQQPRAPAVAKRFKPPSLDEVKAYAGTVENGAGCAGRFFDHYTANGWKKGRVPMKCWQAAFRNWVSREPDMRHNGQRPTTKPQVTTHEILPLPIGYDKRSSPK